GPAGPKGIVVRNRQYLVQQPARRETAPGNRTDIFPTCPETGGCGGSVISFPLAPTAATSVTRAIGWHVGYGRPRASRRSKLSCLLQRAQPQRERVKARLQPLPPPANPLCRDSRSWFCPSSTSVAARRTTLSSTALPRR